MGDRNKSLLGNRRAFMCRLAACSGAASLAAAPLALYAAVKRRVHQVRISANAQRTRLVIDLDGPVKHSLFVLKGPERVVIDIEDARLSGEIPLRHSGLIRNVRNGVRRRDDLRFVLDLTGQVRAKSFLLKPQGKHGYRLVVDLLAPSANRKQPKKYQQRPLRNVIIAIDPGHGGRDPGATGRNGTHEKDITLSIARKLATLLKREHGMQPVLIRNGDRFITLRERVKRAHDAKADLLISLHADSFKDPRARGASVYALSLRGATSEAAKWLADKENAADLIGGVSLHDKDDLVASVLLDLAQTATIESSVEIGDHILSNLKRVGKVHKRSVQQAGFTVLKNPDIPSVLIETAFISNPREEKKLATPAHQEKMAQAILRGVRSHFSRKAPPGTLLSASQQRKVG